MERFLRLDGGSGGRLQIHQKCVSYGMYFISVTGGHTQPPNVVFHCVFNGGEDRSQGEFPSNFETDQGDGL